MQAAVQAVAPRPIAGLYAVTPAIVDTKAMIALVVAALEGGASAIQYRNKIATSEKRLQQALALRALCKARRATLIINDDVDLARAVAADGVHLGRDDAGVPSARARLGDSAIIGASCYDSQQLADAAVAAGANYIAFGSFFPSITKPGTVPAGVSLLHSAKERWKVPVVAIGGITPANAGALIDAGADAVAVISALFGAPDVAAAARSFVSLFDR